MGTLLERWVSQRVGYCVRLNADNIGRVLYDGRVFNDILKSYGLGKALTFGELRGHKKKTVSEAHRYLTEMCDTFRFLNIDFDDDYSQKIANGSGPYAVRLLYKLYEKLEDKLFLKLFEPKKIDIFAEAIKSLLCDEKSQFSKLKYIDDSGNDLKLIKEYEEAKQKIIENCIEEIHKRRELFKEREMDRIKSPFENDDIRFLSKLRQLAKKTELDDELLDSETYVDTLKTNERQRQNLEHQRKKTLPKNVVNTIDPSSCLDDIKAKLIQQSDYEKFQAKKWVKAHHTFRTFFEKKLDQYVDSDNEADVNHQVRNEILRTGGDKLAELQKPKWDLHEKLYAKRMRRNKRANDITCRHVVDDLIDVLMRTLLYRYENKRAPVPKNISNDWKEAFFKSKLTPLPNFGFIDSSDDEEEENELEDDDELDKYILGDYDSEVFIDREVTKLIDEFNLHSYLYLVGPWDGDNLPLEHEENDMMVNGFIVHRLLETKYPLPIGYQDPQFDFTYRAAMSPIKDQNSAFIYSTVRNLLAKQNVAVIDVVEPMNYCLTVYHGEMGAIDDEENKKEIETKALKLSKGRKSSMKKRSSKGGSQRASKAGGGKRASKAGGGKRASKAGGGKRASKAGSGKRASKASGGKRSSKVGGKKGRGRKSLGGSKKSSESTKRTKDIALQFPSLDEMVPRVNHSTAGLLGKEAFQAINQGQHISDLLAGKMLVEYLKDRKTSIKGFALVSYPLTVSQGILLEFLMTGRPFKTEYPIKPEIEKFISDELRPQPYVDSRFLVDWEELYSPDLQALSSDILGVVADDNATEILNKAKCEKILINKTMRAMNNLDAALLVESNVPFHAQIKMPPSGLFRNTMVSLSNPQQPESPNWILKSHNIRTLSGEELAHRIRTRAYELGRFRPYIATESYDKLQSHVINLLEWIRSDKKYGRKWCSSYKCEEENECQSEFESDVETLNQNDYLPVPNDRVINDVNMINEVITLPEAKRPVTYVQLLKLRTSEIMPRPNEDRMEIHYLTSSYFDKFVKCLPVAVAKKEEDDYQKRVHAYEESIDNDDEETKIELNPIVEDLPDSFYKVFGKKEVLDYDNLNYDSITKLCRMIINEPWIDEDPKRRDSMELFDEDELRKLRKQLPGKKKSSRKSSRRGSRKSSRRASRRKSSRRGSRKNSVRRQSSRRSSKRKSSRRGSRRQSSKNTRRSTAVKGKNSAKKKKVLEKKSDIAKVVEEEEENEYEEGHEEEMVEELIPNNRQTPPHYPKPGENGWSYLVEEIPPLYQILLATTWEAVEFEYLSNLQYSFYLIRAHDHRMIPYRNFVRREIDTATTFDDQRPFCVVSNFQKLLSNLSPKQRTDSEIKRTFNCRLLSLYDHLVDIADEKRARALARRDELINQRWVHKYLFTLSNLFLGLIQIEVNRTIQSLQLMSDYFNAMLQKPPERKRLELCSIPKVFLPKRNCSVVSSVNMTINEKKLAPWEEAVDIPELPQYVMKIVSDLDRLLVNRHKITPNPAYSLIARGVEIVNTTADGLANFFEATILNPQLGEELRPKILKKLSPEEDKRRKKMEKSFRKMLETVKTVEKMTKSPSEGRDSKPPKIKRKKRLKGEDVEFGEKRQIDPNSLQMVDQLKWEWLVAVRNEIKRLRLRVNRIKQKAEFDLDEALHILESGFEEFFLDVGWEYRREIKTLEKAVKIFKTAVDSGENIPFFMGNFYTGTGDKFPDEISPPPNTPTFFLPKTFEFSFLQLNNFLKKMEAVSPDGILNGVFVDILHDMATYNEETEFEFLPESWSELSREDLIFIVRQIFGDEYVVSWRDFLLFCVGLRYPSVEEIIDMRRKFNEADDFGYENVKYSRYLKLPLWFERDLETEEELNWGRNVKDFLFNLFRTSRKEVNYTELLLALCKGKEPEEGFGKGLSLVVGVGYVFWPDPPDWIHPRHVVDYVLIQLLHDVIVKADYMTVETLSSDEPEEFDMVEESQKNEQESEHQYCPTEERVEEIESEETEETILWQTCVPFEACLALLVVALRFWVCPPAHKFCQSDVESQLRELFFVQGVGSHIKAYKLAQSDLVKNIFNDTSAFRECYVPELAYRILQSKRHVVGALDLLNA